MMRRVPVSVVLAAALAAGCASDKAHSAPTASEVLPLGDHFESRAGSLFVIRIQDEYQLIRCIPEGPIAGCFDNLFSVPRAEVKFNRWMKIPKLPGVELAIVSPTVVAFRVDHIDTGEPLR